MRAGSWDGDPARLFPLGTWATTHAPGRRGAPSAPAPRAPATPETPHPAGVGRDSRGAHGPGPRDPGARRSRALGRPATAGGVHRAIGGLRAARAVAVVFRAAPGAPGA